MEAKEILDIRKKLKLTQTEMAYHLGSHTSTVNRWETGAAKMSRSYISLLTRLLADMSKTDE